MGGFTDSRSWVTSDDPETQLACATVSLRPALEAARDVNAPDWLLCAGAIRDAVWDTLHGRAPAPPRDVDVVFFGGDEADVLGRLKQRAPTIGWDARDLADVHCWYPVRRGRRTVPQHR